MSCLVSGPMRIQYTYRSYFVGSVKFVQLLIPDGPNERIKSKPTCKSNNRMALLQSVSTKVKKEGRERAKSPILLPSICFYRRMFNKNVYYFFPSFQADLQHFKFSFQIPNWPSNSSRKSVYNEWRKERMKNGIISGINLNLNQH